MGPYLYVILSLLGLLGFMALFIAIARLRDDRVKSALCPYALTPLRRLDTLHYTTLYRLEQFLEKIKNYDNRPFKIRKAAYCRELGRIYPDSINWRGKMKVDWTFLQKKEPGVWISWGSLPPDRQRELREKHGSLEGFQTTLSSAHIRPQDAEREFVLARPGPLYVNLENNSLLGWFQVPGTDLEILYLKRPLKYV